MKCGMNETNATVKISPLSIKQFRHARTIPILSSIYFRPYIYIYIHTLYAYFHRVWRIFNVRASLSHFPVLPSIHGNPWNLQYSCVREREKEGGRERDNSETLLPSYRSCPISYFSFLSAPLPPPTFVCMSERKKEGRRKKEEKKVASSKLGTGCNTVA